MRKVILVVASLPTGHYISEIVSAAGYEVMHAAATSLESVRPSPGVRAVLVALNTPPQIQDLAELRRTQPELPLLVLGPDDPEIRIKLFERGIDDYVVTPFDPDELVARIRSVTRRFALRGTSQSDPARCS